MDHYGVNWMLWLAVDYARVSRRLDTVFKNQNSIRRSQAAQRIQVI